MQTQQDAQDCSAYVSWEAYRNAECVGWKPVVGEMRVPAQRRLKNEPNADQCSQASNTKKRAQRRSV